MRTHEPQILREALAAYQDCRDSSPALAQDLLDRYAENSGVLSALRPPKPATPALRPF